MADMLIEPEPAADLTLDRAVAAFTKWLMANGDAEFARFTFTITKHEGGTTVQMQTRQGGHFAHYDEGPGAGVILEAIQKLRTDEEEKEDEHA